DRTRCPFVTVVTLAQIGGRSARNTSRITNLMRPSCTTPSPAGWASLFVGHFFPATMSGFPPNTGHLAMQTECPLRATSGYRATQIVSYQLRGYLMTKKASAGSSLVSHDATTRCRCHYGFSSDCVALGDASFEAAGMHTWIRNCRALVRTHPRRFGGRPEGE